MNATSDSSFLFNLVVSILRFANVFFVVCVPLLSQQNRELVVATPWVGTSGAILIAVIFVSNYFSNKLMQLVPLLNVVCGFMLLVLFSGVFSHRQLGTYVVFACIVGTSLIATEALGLRLTLIGEGVDDLRRKLADFNSLKVFGMALGFLLGCLIAASQAYRIAANISVSIIGTVLIVLSVIAYLRFRRRPLSVDKPEVDRHWTRRTFLLSMFYFVLIMSDLAVFFFWYSYIPDRLHNVYGLPTQRVGVWLALQAFIHALSQKIWKRVLPFTGELVGYWISFSLHIAVVFLITNTIIFSTKVFTLLFCVMGIVNAGTYTASTTLYYSTIPLRSKYRMTALHLMASNIGKAVGARVAAFII